GRNLGEEAIAAPRHGLDVARLVRVVAQDAAQFVDVAAQQLFVDGDIAPDAFEQFFLGYEPARILNENAQHFGGLGPQRYALSIPPQRSGGEIEAKGAEM